MVRSFIIPENWQLILHELQLHPVEVLSHAGMPLDLLTRPNALITEEGYFLLFDVINNALRHTPLPLAMEAKVPIPALSPAVLAVSCCSNMNSAAQQLQSFRKLISPLNLHVEMKANETTCRINRVGPKPPPVIYAMVELVFFVRLARYCTRTRLRPTYISVIKKPDHASLYEDYFGVSLSLGPAYSVSFSAEDAKLPFLTANHEMWNYLAPALRERLSDMNKAVTAADRVFELLYELIPDGSGSIKEVSARLGTGVRTLQRQLAEENTTFNEVLRSTREELARHYLENPALNLSEIAYLLGYDDPTSFFRAFKSWTGQTPKNHRASNTY